MRRSQSSSEHAEALSRRLATLSAELAAVRGEPSGDGWDGSPHTRVRARPDDVPVPVVLPVPGRHASRRMRIGGLQLGPVHLSGEMSGTFESAQLAALELEMPVHVVDSGQVGIATGYAALTACDVLDAGGTAEEAAEAALARGEAATSLFYVDTLEYLRRGGRIGAAAKIFGSALSVKPLLEIVDGRVQPRERVRTASRALARLADLAVEAAGDRSVDVCVSHLANAARAEELASALTERLAGGLEGRDVMCGELGAVLGAHVGPGMVAVCVSPRLSTDRS